MGMANGRVEFTGPTISELPVDHATPLVMAVNTGQQVDSRGETSMELDEEPLDSSTHWLSQHQRVIHLLVFYTCLEWSPTCNHISSGIHTRELSGYVHHTVTRPASPLHHYMASHTGISVSVTLGMFISSLDYTQNYKASVPLGNHVHWNRVLPQGVQLYVPPHIINDIPLELALKGYFQGTSP